MPNSITFINHATVLIEWNGTTMLTDPFYARTISYFIPRLRQPGIPFHWLPHIDLILISHNHYDHLNLKTLRKLKKRDNPVILFTRGVGKYGKRLGFSRYHEINLWEEIKLCGVKITCVPAKHFSGRILWNRSGSVHAGFILQKNEQTIYFAGDTGYAPFFKELGERFSIDVALLPIGAYKPRRWLQPMHMDPVDALNAFHDCRARHMIPIHWGTFKLSDEPMSEPPQLLREESVKRGMSDQVHILKNGESFLL